MRLTIQKKAALTQNLLVFTKKTKKQQCNTVGYPVSVTLDDKSNDILRHCV